MFDIKMLGIKIAVLRKQSGLSQEKLAEVLGISPQAISKWENGHSAPDTSMLPILAQVFNCTIDEIVMPAYTFDAAIEDKKINIIELQAKQIAKCVIEQLGITITEKAIGLDNEEILDAVHKVYPNLGNCEIIRGNQEKCDRYTSLYITVITPQMEIKLVEKIYCNEDCELLWYKRLRQYALAIPLIYYVNLNKKIILMEDLNANGIQGVHFDEENEKGEIYRRNYHTLLSETANLHAAFWSKKEMFQEVGLNWRHKTKENLLAHIDGMEEDFLKYRRNEESGNIPQVWNGLCNRIHSVKLDYFHEAIKFLRREYVVLAERFHAGENITMIHGDLHPGNTFLIKSVPAAMKIIDLEAVRVGLCTEDLAMLLALHIEPDKKLVMPLLKQYYECLCQKVSGYSYEQFLWDYKLSVIEFMFYPIKLINNGIYDFVMRDKAIRAYETFVIDREDKG